MYTSIAVQCGIVVIQNIAVNKRLMRYKIGEDREAALPDGDWDNALMRETWVGPIKVESAKARDEADKRMIDDYIMSLHGGFDTINQSVKDAMIASCPDD